MTVKELIDQLDEYGDHHEVCIVLQDRQRLMVVTDVALIAERGVVGLWPGGTLPA